MNPRSWDGMGLCFLIIAGGFSAVAVGLWWNGDAISPAHLEDQRNDIRGWIRKPFIQAIDLAGLFLLVSLICFAFAGSLNPESETPSLPVEPPENPKV